MSRPYRGYEALSGSAANTPESGRPPDSDPIGSTLSPAASPESPQRHRRAYHRISSSGEFDISQYQSVRFAEEDDDDTQNSSSERQSGIRHGLGISTGGEGPSIPRRPVGASVNKNSRTRSVDSVNIMSPFSSGTTARDVSPLSYKSTDPLQQSKTPPDSTSSFQAPFRSATELSAFKRSIAAAPEPGYGNYDGGNNLPFKCRTRPIYQSRLSWLTITILVLSVFSTVFSGIYLVLALVKPRYGKTIRSHGDLTPSTASTLCTLIAKMIELSFVTVFVAFLGQAISRKAFQRSRGMTISEMSMRSWIMQPGTLITHWEAVRYSGLSFLGAISLTAAFVATFYTTAAEALVSPKLKFGDTEHRMVYGSVTASYANINYAQDTCHTPIPVTLEDTEDNLQNTCLNMQHVGASYHNYDEYMARWARMGATGNTSSVHLKDRPRPVATLFDNTTVYGAWVQEIDMDKVSQKYNRTVNNITMAMPHANVFAAARLPINNILQPEDLLGLGEYYVTASVPSPALNVLCASVTADELEPMVYTSWNGGRNKLNVTTWPQEHDLPDHKNMNYSTISNDLIELFFLGNETGQNTPPVFPKLPEDYNTVDNFTSELYLPSVYLLGKTAPGVMAEKPYVMCSMRSMQYPNCSTTYHASLSGGTLGASCEKDAGDLAYNVSHPEAPVGFVDPEWRNLAQGWMPSVSLGTGISNEGASNARQFMELVPVKNDSGNYKLNPNLPSIAEALAVQASGTLLLATTDAPFIHFWNYSTENHNILKAPQLQGFNATVRTQDYSSGGAQKWQGIFYVILIVVFLTNCFCLVYLIMKGGQITDFTEPQNLFTLAINSPPSRLMARACGAGPKKDQFKRRFVIEMKEGEEHMYARCLGDEFMHGAVEDADQVQVRDVGDGRWEVVESDTSLRYRGLVRAKPRFI